MIVMLPLRGYCFLSRSLISWRTTPISTRSVPSKHGAVFFCGPITARRGLFPSQDRSIYHISSTTERCENLLSGFRQLSTSSKTGCNHIGKIESTHYQLIYTCKVRHVVKCSNVYFRFYCLVIFVTIYMSCRFALLGPRRRSPSRLITRA